MGIMKYAEIIRIDLIEKATYIWDQLVLGGIIAVLIFIFVHVWTAIFAGRTIIEGFSLAQIIWYLAITETIMFAQGNDFIERIGEEVRSGAVGITLLKPLNYVFKEFAQIFSGFVFKFVTIGAIALAIAQSMVGTITLDVSTMPFFLLTAFGSFLLSFCIICSLGFTAFWFEDSRSIYFIYQKGVFILGGMLIPIEMYPVWLQNIVAYLPTTYMIYAPAKLFVSFNWQFFLQTILAQAIWTVLAAIILALVYQKAISKVTVHGG